MDKPAVARASERGAPSYSIWQLLGLLAGPLLFVFLYILVRPDGMPPAAGAVLAGTFWLAAWAVTGAVPVAVTSLLPLLLFPVLGLAPLTDAAARYAAPTVCVLLGGCLAALAALRWNLHRRIALSITALPGASPARLVLGFLAVTALLATWLSSTVTAVIMLPLGLAVITHQPLRSRKVIALGGAPQSGFGTAVVLAVAYGAAFGGLPLLPKLLVMACGGVMLLRVCPPDTAVVPGSRQELAALGPFSRSEKQTLAVFAVMVVMWIIRPYGITPYLPLVDDATIALLGGVLLFLIPTDLHNNQWLLTADALPKVPWSILLLFGAGFSIAGAAQSSGLWPWIAGSLPPLAAGVGQTVGPPILVLVVTAGAAAALVGSLPVRQLARAGLWLMLTGGAISTVFANL